MREGGKAAVIVAVAFAVLFFVPAVPTRFSAQVRYPCPSQEVCTGFTHATIVINAFGSPTFIVLGVGALLNRTSASGVSAYGQPITVRVNESYSIEGL